MNWVCAKAPIRDSNNRLILCHGRCVTDEGCYVRLSKKGHNHPAVDIEITQTDKYELMDEINYKTLLLNPNTCQKTIQYIDVEKVK